MTYIQNELWNKNAIGFVTRARQELWGKHNSEMMAFLFERGLSNKTLEMHLLGWNRRSKSRSAEKWGITSGKITEKGSKLFFPEGIVVPFVVDKQLRKIIIVATGATPSEDKNYTVEGSQPISMVYGKTVLPANTFVTDHILDGLYVLQELGENANACLIIPHDLSQSPDDFVAEQLNNSDNIVFLTRDDSSFYEKWMLELPHAVCSTYKSLEELYTIIT